MSKEEFLKIQTCVLKVNIHCDGCKHKVKKILQKIDGVYKISIDSDLGKVTVSGNVDPPTLIKKLIKNGKHAELWASPKPNQNQSQNQNQNQFLNQLKNLQIDNRKGGNGNNPLKGGQNGQKGMFVNNPPKGGQNGQFPNQQQLMQMKAFQDMKLPQLKDFKLPNNNNNGSVKDQKAVKFSLPEDDHDLSDDDEDDYDDDEDDYDDDDDMEDDDMDDDLPPHRQGDKMKPSMGNNGLNPNMMMNPNLMGKIVSNGAGGQNGQKGGPGGGGAGLGPNPSGAKKGGGGNGNSMQIQGGGGNMGKGGGGEGKMVNNGGGQSKNGGGQNGNFNVNGGKKGGGVGMGEGVQGLPNMGKGSLGPMGPMGNMPMGPMGQMPMGPMGQMGQAVRGLPATGMGGYFGGGGPDAAVGNQYQHQYQNQNQNQNQLAAMMMNQQRANGNEQFHPMMYARPPPAVNYMPPPYAYTYPYAPGYPPPGEPYTHAFNDENTSSCNVM